MLFEVNIIMHSTAFGTASQDSHHDLQISIEATHSVVEWKHLHVQ
jgi:hypothetical protein